MTTTTTTASDGTTWANLPNDIIREIYWHHLKCDTSRGFWRLADARTARLCRQPRPVKRGPRRVHDRPLAMSRLLQAAYDGHAAGVRLYLPRWFAASGSAPPIHARTGMDASEVIYKSIAIAVIQGGALGLWPEWSGCLPVVSRMDTVLHYAVAYGRERFLRHVWNDADNKDRVSNRFAWFERIVALLYVDYRDRHGEMIEACRLHPWSCDKFPRWCMVEAVAHRQWALVDTFIDWALNVPPADPPRVPRDKMQLLFNACAAYGHVEVLRNVVAFAPQFISRDMIAYAISNGDTTAGLLFIEAALPAVLANGLTQKTARSRPCLRMACMRGHVPILQWLWERGHLDPKHWRAALEKYKKPDVLAWLQRVLPSPTR